MGKQETQCVIFVTEMITSGTLKMFIQTRPLRVRIMKRWCRQILSALNYLHNHTPPIIHRDMKCDNIFINGSMGDIRIGDLGLACWQRDDTAMSVLARPSIWRLNYTTKTIIRTSTYTPLGCAFSKCSRKKRRIQSARVRRKYTKRS